MVVYHLGSFFWPRIAIGKVSFIRATKDAPLRNLNTNRNIVFFVTIPLSLCHTCQTILQFTAARLQLIGNLGRLRERAKSLLLFFPFVELSALCPPLYLPYLPLHFFCVAAQSNAQQPGKEEQGRGGEMREGEGKGREERREEKRRGEYISLSSPPFLPPSPTM